MGMLHGLHMRARFRPPPVQCRAGRRNDDTVLHHCHMPRGAGYGEGRSIVKNISGGTNQMLRKINNYFSSFQKIKPEQAFYRTGLWKIVADDLQVCELYAIGTYLRGKCLRKIQTAAFYL